MAPANELELCSFFACALVLICSCVGCYRLPDTNRGEIQNQTDWPDPIVALAARLKTVDPDVSIQGYLLSGELGSHSIEYAIFRIENASPECFETASAELELVETNDDLHRKWWNVEGREPPPAEWWTEPTSNTSRPFASRGRLEGDEGDLYYASYDPANEIFFVEYYFNF